MSQNAWFRGNVAGSFTIWCTPAADPGGVADKRAMRAPGPRRLTALSVFMYNQLTLGAVASAALTGGISFSRAVPAAMAVQTGTGAIVTGLGVDTAGVGMTLDGRLSSLAINESRTQQISNNRGINGAGWLANSGGTITANYGGKADPAGTNLSTRFQTTTNLQFSKYQQTAALTGTFTFSMFTAATVGTTEGNPQLGDNTLLPRALTVAWQRLTNIVMPVAAVIFLTPVDAVPTQPSDSVIDFCQIEDGAFVTDPIPTSGSSLTRAGEQLRHANAALIADSSGRFGIDVVMRPKGGTYDYSANARLWTVGANYCELDFVTGCVRVVIGASTVILPGVIRCMLGQRLELYVAAGGGSAPTNGSYRIDGGPIFGLGSGAVQGAIPTGGTIDLFCNATALQWSANVENHTTYPGAG